MYDNNSRTFISHYKDHKINIGSSDYASLVMVYCDRGAIKAKMLKFGGDGYYTAYLVKDKDCEIPDYYEEVLSLSGWLKIYDDEQMMTMVEADTINVLRAGQYGVIIRAVDIE